MEPRTIALPWPPSTNTYWRHARGIHYISKEGKAYRQNVLAVVVDSRIEKFTGRLRVFVTAYPPDKRKRDLDNLFKSLLDALQHADVYDDDNQIDDLRIVRGKPCKGGQLLVTVEEL